MPYLLLMELHDQPNLGGGQLQGLTVASPGRAVEKLSQGIHSSTNGETIKELSGVGSKQTGSRSMIIIVY